MRRLVCCSVLALMALVPATARAQRAYLVGVGATLTSGDYADIDSVKSGTTIMGGYEMPIFTSSTSLRLDGSVSRMRRKTDFKETQHLAGLYARLVFWPLSAGPVRPYLMGGVGYLYNKYNPGQTVRQSWSDSEIVFGGGVGSEINVGPVSTFVEGRYDTGSNTKAIIPILVGVRLKSGS